MYNILKNFSQIANIYILIAPALVMAIDMPVILLYLYFDQATYLVNDVPIIA